MCVALTFVCRPLSLLLKCLRSLCVVDFCLRVYEFRSKRAAASEPSAYSFSSPKRFQSLIFMPATACLHQFSTCWSSALAPSGLPSAGSLIGTLAVHTMSAFFLRPAMSTSIRHSARPIQTSSGLSPSRPGRGAPEGSLENLWTRWIPARVVGCGVLSSEADWTCCVLSATT